MNKTIISKLIVFVGVTALGASLFAPAAFAVDVTSPGEASARVKQNNVAQSGQAGQSQSQSQTQSKPATNTPAAGAKPATAAPTGPAADFDAAIATLQDLCTRSNKTGLTRAEFAQLQLAYEENYNRGNELAKQLGRPALHGRCASLISYDYTQAAYDESLKNLQTACDKSTANGLTKENWQKLQQEYEEQYKRGNVAANVLNKPALYGRCTTLITWNETTNKPTSAPDTQKSAVARVGEDRNGQARQAAENAFYVAKSGSGRAITIPGSAADSANKPAAKPASDKNKNTSSTSGQKAKASYTVAVGVAVVKGENIPAGSKSTVKATLPDGRTTEASGVADSNNEIHVVVALPKDADVSQVRVTVTYTK